MPAPKNNQHATKPESLRQSVKLTFALTRSRRTAYLRAAAGGKLVSWITRHLDRAAGYDAE